MDSKKTTAYTHIEGENYFMTFHGMDFRVWANTSEHAIPCEGFEDLLTLD